MRKNRLIQSRFSSHINARRGALTVEFALTASLFFTIFLASVEFTRFMFARNSVDQAAYEACRFAIVPGNSAAGAIATGQNFLTRAGISKNTVTIQPATITSSTRSVTVTARADFAQNSWLAPVFAKNVILQSTVTLDHENLSVLLQNP